MCPSEDCCLEVKDGKVFCTLHKKFLRIAQDWVNSTKQIPMRHVLYVAYSNGKENQILIDEEC